MTHREVSVTESEMDSSRCFRKKAAQCRRLASDILREHEPVRRVLLEMAAELEDRATALESNAETLSPWQFVFTHQQL
jgi:hypothetical protein